ncbi:MAG: efflux RND transporter periplasmic adaptor subunit [Proteobacteria bacterium]|nr:efflux RND transporter periplasmic adaptor subunit [Pseudomonadota bacterium]
MDLKARWKRQSLGWRRMILVVAVVIPVFMLIYAFPLGMFLAAGFESAPAPVVSTVIVRAEPWQPRLDVIGSLTASTGADLAVEVSGIVEEVYFDSGGDVEAGARLVRLRATDETARLATLQAQAELAAATHRRNQRLFDIQGISEAEFETSSAALKSAEATVDEQRAVIEKKLVRAPFDGHLGIRNVNVGQYVNPGTIVVTLQALDPINFDFFVPQQMLERLHPGQLVEVHVDAYPNTIFTGHITTIDPKIDLATRNVAVRTMLPNSDHRLLPGMYATARIDTGAQAHHLTLPQTAVTFNPYGTTVYRVEEQTEDGQTKFVVRQTFVTTGETRGDQVAILSGISEGDEIVSAGQFKLQNGAAIEINNDVQPLNDPNPTPVER